MAPHVRLCGEKEQSLPINVEIEQPSYELKQLPKGLMKANVFRGPGKYGLEDKPIPTAGPGEAVVEVRLTTICGTDIHIIRVNIQWPPVSRLATKRWELFMSWALGPPAIKSASEFWLAQSRLAVSANPVFFSAAESGHIRIGDTVAVFAQGPIGLCAIGERSKIGLRVRNSHVLRLRDHSHDTARVEKKGCSASCGWSLPAASI